MEPLWNWDSKENRKLGIIKLLKFDLKKNKKGKRLTF